MLKSLYNAAYLAITIRFLRDIRRKLLAPSPKLSGKDICHTVLLRPTPPGPLPIAACAGYRTAADVARRLNAAGIPNCRFAAMYPEYKYDDRSKHHVRQKRVCPLYDNTMKLPDSTQSALYRIFSSIDPKYLTC